MRLSSVSTAAVTKIGVIHVGDEAAPLVDFQHGFLARLSIRPPEPCRRGGLFPPLHKEGVR